MIDKGECNRVLIGDFDETNGSIWVSQCSRLRAAKFMKINIKKKEKNLKSVG